MPTNELKTWQAQAQAQTELLLARLMPSENQLPQSLHETMRYACAPCSCLPPPNWAKPFPMPSKPRWRP